MQKGKCALFAGFLDLKDLSTANDLLFDAEVAEARVHVCVLLHVAQTLQTWSSLDPLVEDKLINQSAFIGSKFWIRVCEEGFEGRLVRLSWEARLINVF